MKRKKIIKRFLLLLLIVTLVIGGYLIYLFTDYYRLEDHLPLSVTNNQSDILTTGEPYRLISWNIGFGAYESDYGFFMDGGTESWAWSEARLLDNLDAISTLLAKQNADFLCVQEVDTDSTRSYHVDEANHLVNGLSDRYASVWAQNYDSPFLFYPFTQPHGKSVAGLMTLSRYQLSDSIRHSLPVETGFMKLVDLDRCYSVTRIPVDNGKMLCLYNLHLSAYSSDGSIADTQIKQLLTDAQTEYDAGNYVVCAGDFNKDLLGDSSAYFGISGEDYTWAQAFPFDLIPDTLSLIAPLDKESPVPSCRNADGPYSDEQFVLTIDGFLVSPNVTVSSSSVIDTEFAYSDHNPVALCFTLGSE
ncbi:MAG: endonuclease/exonuclease/phosphatase family protein [Oscillospiraceae bacterium]|jgi:endonuclease/exonuclease/phosphatase family metal-dependent hydrolase